MNHKANQVRFFEKTFLVANVGPEMVFVMLFLTLSRADVDFLGRELLWRTYTIKKALSTTRYIKLVCMKEFASAVIDLEYKTYVVHIGSVSSVALPSFFPFDIYPFHIPQIAGLIAEKAPTKVSAEYSDFADVFSSNFASKLPKHTRINDDAIELVNG